MVTASPCARCGGLGQVITSPCGSCRGEGRVTVDKTYQVDVPAGVDSGSTLRLTGRGAVGPRGGRSGDLYVHLRVAPHDLFVRDDHDLVTEVPISIAQASLGTAIELETLDGTEHLVIPPGTQPGREFVLRQRGVPHLRGRGRGDLRARCAWRYPRSSPTRRSNSSRRTPKDAVRWWATRKRACSAASSRRSTDGCAGWTCRRCDRPAPMCWSIPSSWVRCRSTTTRCIICVACCVCATASG